MAISTIHSGKLAHGEALQFDAVQRLCWQVAAPCGGRQPICKKEHHSYCHPLSPPAALTTSAPAAKGREWDVVFSPRWYEGFMPSSLFDNQVCPAVRAVHVLRCHD